MAFAPRNCSSAPGGFVPVGPPPPYPTVTRVDERLAEELELRLHLDSLPTPQSVRLNEYSISSDGIRWDIIDRNITKLLGEEAYLWNTVSGELTLPSLHTV